MVQHWERGTTPQQIHVSKFGRAAVSRWFIDPATDQEEEFLLVDIRPGSVILPITEDGRVIAERQFLQGANKVGLLLPGGRGNFEEEASIEIASRELLEETGRKAGTMIPLGHVWIESRSCTGQNWLFLALDCQEVGEPRTGGSEHIELVYFGVKEWVELAQTTLEEPDAICVTFRALPHLRERGLL